MSLLQTENAQNATKIKHHTHQCAQVPFGLWRYLNHFLTYGTYLLTYQPLVNVNCVDEYDG